MPRIPKPSLKEIEAAFADFQSGFRRSRRGNLWRQFEAWTVTIFKHKDGSYGWCISVSDDGAEFSSSVYETEQEALDSVSVELLKLKFG